MGRLADLWAEWRSLDKSDPRRKEVQEEINKVEQYCISHNYAGFTSVTKWYDGGGQSSSYPFHTGAVYLEDIDMVASLNGKGLNFNTDKSVHNCKDCDTFINQKMSD